MLFKTILKIICVLGGGVGGVEVIKPKACKGGGKGAVLPFLFNVHFTLHTYEKQ